MFMGEANTEPSKRPMATHGNARHARRRLAGIVPTARASQGRRWTLCVQVCSLIAAVFLSHRLLIPAGSLTAGSLTSFTAHITNMIYYGTTSVLLHHALERFFLIKGLRVAGAHAGTGRAHRPNSALKVWLAAGFTI